MTSFTKDAIKRTFIELLHQKPLGEITISEITETCGVNRNTFYYHFRDTQALVEEILLDQVKGVLAKYQTLDSIEDCLDAILDEVQDNRETISHIYNSMNRVAFEKYLWEMCYILIESYWQNTASGWPEVSAHNRQLIMDFYAATCFGLAMRWLASGMDDRNARRDAHELCEIALRGPMNSPYPRD